MKKQGPTANFWMVLAIVNLFTLIYPAGLLLRADTDAGHLYAVVALVSAVLLLAITDAVSICMAYWV